MSNNFQFCGQLQTEASRRERSDQRHRRHLEQHATRQDPGFIFCFLLTLLLPLVPVIVQSPLFPDKEYYGPCCCRREVAHEVSLNN